ncbi:RING finger and SPRY domain-containing protein 1 [Balamuthia mandrillaris]
MEEQRQGPQQQTRRDYCTQMLVLLDMLPLCDPACVRDTSELLCRFVREEADEGQLVNALIVWHALSYKFDPRVSGSLFTESLKGVLLEAVHSDSNRVCLHGLITLEGFLKNGGGVEKLLNHNEMVALSHRLRRLALSRDKQLKLQAYWLIHHPPLSKMVGEIDERDEKMEEKEYNSSEDNNLQNDSYVTSTRVMLSSEDKSSCLKLSADYLEVRNDTSSFGSLRANAFVTYGQIPHTNGSRQRASATKKEEKDDSDKVVIEQESENEIAMAKVTDGKNGEQKITEKKQKQRKQKKAKKRVAHKWYFEVKLRTNGVMQIGWATKDTVFNPEEGQGVGDDVFSYAYDGARGYAWHNALAAKCLWPRRRWQKGDVISCLYNGKRGTIIFYLNGDIVLHNPADVRSLTSPEEETATKRATFRRVKRHFQFYPAVSFGAYQQCSFRFARSQWRFFSRIEEEVGQVESIEEYVEREGIPLPPPSPLFLHPRDREEDEGKDSNEERELCSICFAEAADTELQPCHHGGICFRCSLRVTQCPMCRADVLERLQ